ncbi:MAG: nickel-dependent lactate racemase, partial [Planctomycetes bacterium]|nr:nickel-dependent lactate racemase [Planctomycetota bacterium]
MKIKLEYGRNGLWADVPDKNLVAVLNSKDKPAAPDPSALLAESLAHPIGSAPLADLARGKRSACVVITDLTRPIRNDILLPPILAALEHAQVPEIKILIANGIHRPMTDDEIRKAVGEEVAGRYPVLNHLGREKDAVDFVGKTKRGTPVHLNKIYLESDFRVITGLVEPHMYAGYSGGRKSIAIGVAGIDTVSVIHSPLFLEDDSLRAGNIRDNIFHREAVEIALMAPAQFCVNVTINHSREITDAFSGDMIACHEVAMEAVRKTSAQDLPELVDIAVTTNAGYPADLNLYQAGKGMLAGANLVKPGGTVIFAAEFSEGLGGKEFSKLILEAESPDGVMQTLTTP